MTRLVTRVPTRKRRQGIVALALVSALAVASCGGGDASGDDANAGGADTGTDTAAGGDGEPQHGGSITVLLDSGFSGEWSTGLDPARSNSTGANLSQNAAIFGGLFVLEADENGDNAEVVPNQAEGFEWSDDGLKLTISLREGIEFSDGTPLDAEAVLWNWIRQLNSGSTGAPQIRLNTELEPQDLSDEFMDDLWAALPEDVNTDDVEGDLRALRIVDDMTLEMNLDIPNGSLINGFPATNLNLIASPSAYKEIGPDEFARAPVGAGPFVITDNRQSERLTLERNENYFKDNLPYLDELVFQSVGGDQVAYQTLQAGQGDVIEGLSSIPLLGEAENNPDLNVVLGVPTSPYVIQLNTRIAPFDDKRAREAVYYATDFDSINQGLFRGDGEPSQSFTASGGLFHTGPVDGYREYDPAKAQEIVDEIGGLTVVFGTTDTGVAPQVTTALQSQWREAGIDVEIDAKALGDVITDFVAGEWEAMLQTAGAWDPATGIGVNVRFGSTSPYSGTPLPEEATSAADALANGYRTELDDLLAEAAGTVDPDERARLYQEIAKYISDEAYAPFGMAFSPAQVMRNGVHGPGLTTPIPAFAVNTAVHYDRAWIESD